MIYLLLTIAVLVYLFFLSKKEIKLALNRNWPLVATHGSADASRRRDEAWKKYPDNQVLHRFLNADCIRWDICYLATHHDDAPVPAAEIRAIRRQIRKLISDPDLRRELFDALRALEITKQTTHFKSFPYVATC